MSQYSPGRDCSVHGDADCSDSRVVGVPVLVECTSVSGVYQCQLSVPVSVECTSVSGVLPEIWRVNLHAEGALICVSAS